MFAGEGLMRESEPDLTDDGDVGSPGDDPGAAREVAGLLTGAIAAADPVVFTRELSGLLGEVDFESLEGRRLMDATLALEGLQRALDAQKARSIAKLDTTDVTRVSVGLATKAWKTNRCHVSAGSVARELTVAKTLVRFDSFARALAEGFLSSEHVAALANASNPRVLDALIEVQDELVDFAGRNRFNHFVNFLRHTVALLDQDGPEPDHGDSNTARMAADGTGNLHLVMNLTGADAVTAQRIIEAECDRQWRAAVREQQATGVPVPEATLLRARALMELLRRGAKANPASPKPAVEAVITVTVDSNGFPTGVHTIDGQAADPITAAILLCDAHLQPVIVDATGNPLNLGRTVRLFTTGQRRAMAVRDAGCIFPGCDQPVARCAAHHFRQWDPDGPTDIANGGFLCPRHHGLVHATNPWTITVIPIEDLPPDLVEQHRQRAASIGLEPETAVRVWTGPDNQTLLAQTAADHHGPAAGRRRRRQTAA